MRIPPPAGARLAGGKLVGDVVMRPIESVKPNGWNPNEMTEFERAALAHGLKTKGWLLSQVLLVWGTDQRGKRRDVIIDGEQRWTVARELGFKVVPMVIIDHLSERDAKALTFELDSKHGAFDPNKSALLVQSLGIKDVGLGSLELGVSERALEKLLDAAPSLGEALSGNSQPPSGGVSSNVTSRNTRSKMVPLYFEPDRRDAFMAAVKTLSERWGIGVVTDAVERAVLEAAARR